MDTDKPLRGRPKKVRPAPAAIGDDERTAHQEAIGARVVEQRQLRGWSQTDLALRSNLTANAIREIEQGKRSPMTWTIYLMARALNCGAGWLAFGG